MQTKRIFHEAFVTGAILILAAINSENTASAACGHRFPQTHHRGTSGGHSCPAPNTNYCFSTIEIESAYAYGINNWGLVSGFYIDTNGNYDGFLWLCGEAETNVDVSGWTDTLLGGGNDLGVIAGNYGDLPVSHATLYHVRERTWEELPDISGLPMNYGNGINDKGFVAGGAFEGNLDVSSNGVAWIWDGTAYSFFEAPGASGPVYGTLAVGINNLDQVCGYYSDNEGVSHGFLKKGSTITSIDVPGADDTFATAINDLGDIAGNYAVGAVSYGFIMRDGSFVTVDFPGATSTQIYGMNDRGQIVGWYSTVSNANGYAFIGTPLDH
jgi:uncharacterized membrane protein